MKPKTMILLVVAVGCGLAASYMTSKLLAERRQARVEEKLPILVAKQKVPKFTVLKEPEKYFERKMRSKADLPTEYYSEFKDIKDKKLNKDINKDVHISKADVIEKGQTLTGLDIPEGKGAIGLKISNAAVAGGGFVYPGARVNIILTLRGTDGTTQTLLENVEVLAVGDNTSRERNPDEKGPKNTFNTVTVALTPDEAQLIRHAEKYGDLSLFLLNDGDKLKASKMTTLADLRKMGLKIPVDEHNGEATAPLPPIAKKDPEPKKDTSNEVTEPVEPIKPAWTIVIEQGALPPQTIPFFEKDGKLVRQWGDEPPVGEPKTKNKPKQQPPAKKPAGK